ncbi:MAG: HD domain-containing phosphohydrolase [Rhodoferax sp.]|uniref:HD domain-containing phosphohydrolase n=1 Tax=Rhodoferax sp. TaxID=50421 RepID=UPI003265DD36
MPYRPRKVSLHVYVSSLFLALLFAFASIIVTTQYIQTRNMLLASAAQIFERIGQQTSLALNARSGPAAMMARLLSSTRLVMAASESDRLTFVQLMADSLSTGSGISAVYVGYDNGDFILMRQLDEQSVWGRSVQAPVGTVYLVQSTSRDAEGLRIGRFLFYDAQLALLAERLEPNYAFDPRVRTWFTMAKRSSDGIQTDPYIYFTTGEVGITFAHRNMQSTAVVGVDVTLKSLDDLLRLSKASPTAESVITDRNGYVLASSRPNVVLQVNDIGNPVLLKLDDLQQPVFDKVFAHATSVTSAGSAPVAPATPALGANVTELDSDRWLTSQVLLPGEVPITLTMIAPEPELLVEAYRIRRNLLWLVVGALLLAIPAALWLSRLVSKSLNRLTTEANEINSLRFEKPLRAKSFIVEIDRLASAMATMKATITRLLAISAVLGGEKRFDHLLNRIVGETIQVANARGGVVYLTEPDGKLKPQIASMDGELLTELQLPILVPGVDDDHPVVRAAAGHIVEALLTPAEATRWYPALDYTGAFQLLAIPLMNRRSELIGVLLLSSDPDADERAQHIHVRALVEAVSGTAAAAIETNRLILEQKQMMEGIIELIAGAIDYKSPYTGGHCARVPMLTEMLAKAAVNEKQGHFQDFTLNEEQWEELSLAAWLHDCGKVTSPEYVIDKATKLETISDRLHEVRTRFEVIKREAEVACWKDIAAGGLQGAERDARLALLQALWAELDNDFGFVAASNVGGEFMAPAHIERLQKIAARTWTRTLDDRVGLSHIEQARRQQQPVVPLPAQEPLLADRPDHIIERPARETLAEDNPWGFKMKVPQHLYNYGEIYNLSIRRGTLTDEERFKVNEHMIETIRMLTLLPLPRHLRNVPEIAGGHHEKMDGTGYPKRLKRDEMSIPARMMAIADIFEALTAADRPYKKAKTLSESIAIMAKMRDDAHIDPDLFDLFLRSGIHVEYAAKFLNPEQVDEVEVEQYLAQR